MDGSEADAPVEPLPDDAGIAIAAITALELLVGVELADDRRRPAREGVGLRFAAARSRVAPVAGRAAGHQVGPEMRSLVPEPRSAISMGPRGMPLSSGGAREPADLAALASQLRERERRARLVCGEPAAYRPIADAAGVQARLEDAVASALARAPA